MFSVAAVFTISQPLPLPCSSSHLSQGCGMLGEGTVLGSKMVSVLFVCNSFYSRTCIVFSYLETEKTNQSLLYPTILNITFPL